MDAQGSFISKGVVYTHYHLVINTGSSIISKLIYGYDNLKTEFDRAIQMVKDLTDSKVLTQTEYIFTFESGAYVKWQPCRCEVCGIS